MVDSGQTRVSRTIPITLFLVLSFGGLTAVALSGQILIGWLSARENTQELLRDKAQVTIDGIEARVHSSLSPIVAQGQTMARLPLSGPVLSSPHVSPFLVGTLNATPQMQSISVIIPGQSGRQFRRTASAFDVTDIEFGDLQRRVIERVRQVGNPFWGPPRMVDGGVVLTHYTPVLDVDNVLRAVLVQSISGAALSREVARVAVSNEHQTPFILYGESAVIAHPLLVAARANFPEMGQRVPNAAEIGDEILSNIWKANELRLVDLAQSTGDIVKGLSVNGEVYLFAFRAISGYGDKPWVVGAYFDGERTRTQIRRVLFIGLAGLAILLLVAVMALLIGRGTSRPARRLARAAQLVREGELDKVDTLPASLLRELDEASVSFNAMVDGLRERKVIRDLFGKFVPESVASAILHSPQGLAPQSSEATILFVDLAGFTALAEDIGAIAIVDLLNDYIAELVTIIEAHDGIVTQFQGDAILAVFNVPRPVPDHARRAIEVALAITTLVSERIFAGRRLRCRIGIATGSVVAGNVGAPGRMNYTVHGDAVNLAARLEQLSKEYATDILIAQDTVAGVDDIAFRKLGAIDVRGRSARITVYTLDAA